MIESNIPWMWPPWPSTKKLSLSADRLPRRSWRFAAFGVHPSLSADVVSALQAVLRGSSQVRYLGLSCPSGASHHCHFRCHVLGQCEDDLVFEQILKQMMNFEDFTPHTYDPEVLKQKLHLIISSDQFFKAIDFQICTGPFILCHFVHEILTKPLLVYLGVLLRALSPLKLTT